MSKRSDEIAFWRAFRQWDWLMHREDISIQALPSLRTIAADLGIPPKRATYLVEKWAEKRYINYGTSPFAGWITEKGHQTVFTHHDELRADGDWDEAIRPSHL